MGVPGVGDPGFLGERNAHVFVQAGMYMLAPLPNHDQAVLVRQNSTGASTITNFDYGVVICPRLVFGAQWDNGWGFRTAWLYFHEQAPTFTIFTGNTYTVSSIPVPGAAPVVAPGPNSRATGILKDAVSVGALLHLNVWDWEAFYQTQLGQWLVGPSLGVRYATMSQNYNVERGNSGTVRASNGTTTQIRADIDVLQTGHRFDGFGPTIAMDLVRPIGNTGLRFYATPRTSVICGSAGTTTMRFSELFETITPRVGASRNVRTSSGTYSATSSSIAMPVLEAEVGGEWSRDFERHRAFVRCGMVDQEWFDAGDAINVHGALGFIGLALTAGLVY
jgi:hypothetical protein